MDPLSDILALMKPASYGLRGLNAGGDWVLAYPADEAVKCYAIHSGACWIAMEDTGAPVRLAAGDFVLLPTGRAFRLYSALTRRRSTPTTSSRRCRRERSGC